MYRVNAVAMVVLCIAVMGFAAVMAFHISGEQDRPKIDDQSVARLILKLGDEDPVIGDNAERDLTRMGNAVLPNIRAALQGVNDNRAIRLHRILRALEGPSPAVPQP